MVTVSENLMVDTNSRTAQLVHLLSQIGPDIPEIARRLGQYKESVRYRYREKILNKGFSVTAAANYEKLGLKRVMLLVSFPRELREYAGAILTAMNKLCYIVYFARILPEGTFAVDAAVPSEYVEKYGQLMSTLKVKGLFSSVEVLNFDWARNPPMRAELYDFDKGLWDFDWSTMTKPKYATAGYPSFGPENFDYTDLLIIKELQKDANKSLTEIANEVKVNYKKLAWHYTTHVVGRELVKSYRINWMGTRYDYKIEKALHRKHRYVSIVIVVRDVDEQEGMQLMEKSSQLPFLWFEAGGKNYYADFEFPIDFVTEALEYLTNILEPFEGRYNHYALDSTNALTFTVPHELYSQEAKKWRLEVPELLARFDDLLLKIKEAG